MAVQRPDWNQYFMEVARVVASRSTCNRAYVGCVVVREWRILTTGYNGAPAGMPHCDDVGHLMDNNHCIRTLHAEQNALIQAALHGVSTKGAALYVTHQPCFTCAKLIVNAGIVHVIHGCGYPSPSSLALFDAADIRHDAVGESSEASLTAH